MSSVALCAARPRSTSERELHTWPRYKRSSCPRRDEREVQTLHRLQSSHLPEENEREGGRDAEDECGGEVDADRDDAREDHLCNEG